MSFHVSSSDHIIKSISCRSESSYLLGRLHSFQLKESCLVDGPAGYMVGQPITDPISGSSLSTFRKNIQDLTRRGRERGP